MARFGDTIRPELGRTDFSGFLQGAQQGAAAIGQGVERLGAGVGDFLKAQKDQKKNVEGAAQLMESMAALYGDSPIGQLASQQNAFLRNEEIPISKRLAGAEQAGAMLNMFLQKSETDFMRTLQTEQLGLAKQGASLDERRFAHGVGMDEYAIDQAEQEAAGRAAAWGFLPTTGGGPGVSQPGAEGDAGPIPMDLPPGPAVLGPGIEGIGAWLRGDPEVTGLPLGSGRDEAIFGGGVGVDGGAGLLPARVPRSVDSPAARSAFAEEMFKKMQMEKAMAPDLGSKSISGVMQSPGTGEYIPMTVEVMTKDGVPQLPEGFIAASPREPRHQPIEDQQRLLEMAKRTESLDNQFNQLADDAKTASAFLPQITEGIRLLAENKVDTGFGAGAVVKMKQLGESLGIDTSVEESELVQTIMGSEVMQQVSLTKGAVSEKEMDLFIKFSANLGKTTEGNLLILRAKTKKMLRVIEENKLVQKMYSDGKSFGEIQSSLLEHREKNPILTENDLKAVLGKDYKPGSAGGIGGASDEEAGAMVDKILSGEIRPRTPASPASPPSAMPALRGNVGGF